MTSVRNDEGKTEAWIERRGPKYAWAWDEGDRLHRFFGVKGIPHAVLVDPSGTIVWRGHPSGLSEQVLGDTLAGALEYPVWNWPKGSEDVQKALHGGRLADALARAQEPGTPGSATIARALRNMARARVEVIEEARREGDYLRLRGLLYRSAPVLDGLPEMAKVRSAQAELETPRAREVLEGQSLLVQLAERAVAARRESDALDVLERIRRVRVQHAGTIVARQADRWIEFLEERAKRLP